MPVLLKRIRLEGLLWSSHHHSHRRESEYSHKFVLLHCRNHRFWLCEKVVEKGNILWALRFDSRHLDCLLFSAVHVRSLWQHVSTVHASESASHEAPPRDTVPTASHQRCKQGSGLGSFWIGNAGARPRIVTFFGSKVKTALWAAFHVLVLQNGRQQRGDLNECHVTMHLCPEKRQIKHSIFGTTWHNFVCVFPWREILMLKMFAIWANVSAVSNQWFSWSSGRLVASGPILFVPWFVFLKCKSSVSSTCIFMIVPKKLFSQVFLLGFVLLCDKWNSCSWTVHFFFCESTTALGHRPEQGWGFALILHSAQLSKHHHLYWCSRFCQLVDSMRPTFPYNGSTNVRFSLSILLKGRKMFAFMLCLDLQFNLSGSQTKKSCSCLMFQERLPAMQSPVEILPGVFDWSVVHEPVSDELFKPIERGKSPQWGNFKLSAQLVRLLFLCIQLLSPVGNWTDQDEVNSGFFDRCVPLVRPGETSPEIFQASVRFLCKLSSSK